jgi:adenylosuccinate synthase
VGRIGLRTAELTAADLEQRLADLLALPAAAGAAEESRALAAQCRAWAERLSPLVADTSLLLGRWIAAGKSVLFEGAQGTLLDVDFGTYPFVTSSNTTAGAAATGTGVPPTALDGVLGVLKAYSTRVGGGPFPTELAGAAAEHLRRRGNEYGTTTGRPRRCGWFDAVAAAYTVRLNGADALALTKLDVLDDFDEIPVAVAYRVGGHEVTEFPPDLASLAAAEPLYERLPGWKRPTTGVVDLGDLPAAARGYIEWLERRLGTPVVLASTGPRREETIVRGGEPLARLTGGRLGEVIAGRALPGTPR